MFVSVDDWTFGERNRGASSERGLIMTGPSLNVEDWDGKPPNSHSLNVEGLVDAVGISSKSRAEMKPGDELLFGNEIDGTLIAGCTKLGMEKLDAEYRGPGEGLDMPRCDMPGIGTVTISGLMLHSICCRALIVGLCRT